MNILIIRACAVGDFVLNLPALEALQTSCPAARFVLVGYPERGGDGAIYNAACLIGRDGRRLANYRKCHLFGDLDRRMFRAGASTPAVVELDGIRVGLLICYDVEFPESVRLLALAGADLVAVPTALATSVAVAGHIASVVPFSLVAVATMLPDFVASVRQMRAAPSTAPR